MSANTIDPAARWKGSLRNPVRRMMIATEMEAEAERVKANGAKLDELRTAVVNASIALIRAHRRGSPDEFSRARYEHSKATAALMCALEIE